MNAQKAGELAIIGGGLKTMGPDLVPPISRGQCVECRWSAERFPAGSTMK